MALSAVAGTAALTGLPPQGHSWGKAFLAQLHRQGQAQPAAPGATKLITDRVLGL